MIKGLGCYFILLFISFTVVGFAYGESLKDLQEKAVENRKIVEKYKINVQKSELDVKMSKSALLPSLDIAYTANALDKDTLTEKSKNSGITGILSYNIFSGFKDKYNIQSAEHLLKSKEYELESTIQDIKFRVAIRYVDVYGKMKNMSVTEDEYNLLMKRYEDAKNRFDVGLIRKNDLLKINVELDNTKQNMKKVKNEYTKSINTMAFETNSEIAADSLNFNELSMLPEVEAYTSYESKLFEKRSEIKALEMALLARKDSVMSAKAAYYPSVDIAGSATRGGANYILGQGDDPSDLFRLQLNIKMNIFDGFRKYDTVKKAGMEIKTIEYDIEELKKNLSTDLKNTLLDVEVSLENLKVAEGSISQAEENLRITDLSFKEGVGTATDVLDAIYYLSRAKLNYINARNDCFVNSFKLVRMTEDF